MNFKEYQEQAFRTDGGNLTAHFLGLGGEAGEVMELYKKHIAHGHPLEPHKLYKELGDVLWYISAIATGLNLSLEDIAIANIDKLKARYPDKFSAERSINRVEDDDILGED
ncbi:MAG: nucleoside triphosphate pyrophosphohydrolase family protein [Pseudanabaena sp.]|jgi:NTP pyrophosphatase (non-canonical NTP hydrolase)